MPNIYGGIRLERSTLMVIDKDRNVQNIKCIGQMTVGEYYVVGNTDVIRYQAKKAVNTAWGC